MDTEYEQGTYVRTTNRHNGYCAGDFSNRPFPTKQQLDLLLRLPAPVGTGTPGYSGSVAGRASSHR